MAFEFGTTGVQSRNFDVHIKHDGTWTRVGECLKDGIGTSIETNETVPLNVSGEIALDKTGTATFVIANITVDNINFFEGLHKETISVCFEEIKESGTKLYFLIEDVIFNYKENFQSGEVQTLPVEITKIIASPVDFRVIQTTNPM